jgi:hypothetical protein
MKKLFALLITFALVFTACSNGGGGSNDKSDVIGAWSGSYTGGTLTLNIADSTWIMTFNDSNGPISYNGTWTRDANTIKLSDSARAKLSEGKLFLYQTINNAVFLPSPYIYRSSEITLTKKVETPSATVTTLKINNQSFTEITDVIWNNVSFAENQYENSIKSGNNVIKNVQAGGSYIFFKRKSNPITARTREVIIVEAGKNVEFVFRDETIIIEVNNTTNTGAMGSLQNTVVFWDDAEGEMQPYYENRSFVGYYARGSDFPYKQSGYGVSNYYHTPRNGEKSIAVGDTNTAKLHIRITLEKNAKLSFWYANKFNGSAGTIFSINGEEERKWTTDVNWSSMVVALEPGVNDLIWEKKDGGSGTSTSNSYYLSLDDILIYYTE